MKTKHPKTFLTTLFLLCCATLSAHDFEVDGIFYNILSKENKTVEVTYKGSYKDEYSEYSGNVTIPANVTYKGISYSVTTIGDEAFCECWDLISITIPNSVTTIGDNTFDCCDGLTSIVVAEDNTIYDSREDCNAIIETATNTLIRGCKNTVIPNSVTTIGDNAFNNFWYLTSIEIPNSVTTIGDNAFGDCGLTSIEIPNSVTIIGEGAFQYCTRLTSVTIGNSVTTIGDNAFNNCWYLTSIEIPNSVTTIGDKAFYDCTSLTSVTIGNSVTTIGNSAFSDCYGLTSIVIPNSVTTIGDYAFYNCTGLTSVTIGNSVTTIGKNAFYRCTGLTSIEIPNRVTTIGEWAFTYCRNLTRVTIGNSVTTIGNGAFTYCRNLTRVTIGNSVTTIGNGAFGFCTGLTSIEIPNSVTTIGDNAFNDCNGLTSIEIPNSVTTIGDKAFYGCIGLTSIVVAEDNTIYDSREDCNAIIETATNTLIKGCKNTVIPNSVTTIGDEAFCGCKITSIEIPNSVTTIGESAFGVCTNLTSIEIPNSVTTIGDNAFYDCYGLKSITIPNSVTTIGESAFRDCNGLTSVIIGNSVTTIGRSAFTYCRNLTSITSLIPADKLFIPAASAFNFVPTSCTLYVPAGAKETYAATEGWNQFTNIVELVPNEITITVNQYGCGTYCSPNALDFSNVKGLKAYAATGYKSNSKVVILTKVQTAEGGVGLFLKGEPGEYVVPIIESTDEHSLNMLVGTLEQTTVNSTDGNMSNFKFTIIEGEDTPMFYQFEDNTPYSANRAYLQIPTAWLPATAAQKSVSISFEEGETTGIDEVEEPTTDEGIIYNLQGQKVENPTRGIYIVNGKKVFIK